MADIYLSKKEFENSKRYFINEGTENIIYLYKSKMINIFKDINEWEIDEKLKKIKDLKKFEFSKYIIIPEDIVYIDDYPKGFTTTPITNSKNLEDLVLDLNLNEKLHILRTAKKRVVELNEKGIIHSDITRDNFIFDNSDIYLLDMLSCIFDNYSNYRKNILYNYYLKKCGTIDKNFDIYSFNIMTYCFLAKIYTPFVYNNLSQYKYGIIKSPSIQNMLNNLLLKNGIYNDEFIIDKIPNKRYFLNIK